MKYKNIAYILNTNINVVKTTANKIYIKNHVDGRFELVMKALQL